MLNTLDDYIGRSVDPWAPFHTNPNLGKKVADSGAFLPYFGNTTVFLLDEETKTRLGTLQRELYDAVGWMLAEPLQPETFHMTLHDLVNGPVEDEALLARMAEAAPKARALVEAFRQGAPLHMEATWLFNMVNTSIVLGLRPADEESRRRLDQMYTALEGVVPLGYALTPHITMAYYRPGQWAGEPLARALHPVELPVELSMEHLMLQNFRDMNTYWSPDRP